MPVCNCKTGCSYCGVGFTLYFFDCHPGLVQTIVNLGKQSLILPLLLSGGRYYLCCKGKNINESEKSSVGGKEYSGNKCRIKP